MTGFAEIQDNFEFLNDWEDRYRYVIELGRGLEPLTAAERNDQSKVHGCASQVWLVRDDSAASEQPVLTFRGDSDAHIVRGLIAILLALYNGRTAEDALAVDAQAKLAALGLDDHLSPQRSNGLKAMIARVQDEAQRASGDGS